MLLIRRRRDGGAYARWSVLLIMALVSMLVLLQTAEAADNKTMTTHDKTASKSSNLISTEGLTSSSKADNISKTDSKDEMKPENTAKPGDTTTTSKTAPSDDKATDETVSPDDKTSSKPSNLINDKNLANGSGNDKTSTADAKDASKTGNPSSADKSTTTDSSTTGKSSTDKSSESGVGGLMSSTGTNKTTSASPEGNKSSASNITSSSMMPTTAPNSTVGGLNATMKPDNMTMANNKTIQPDSHLPVANISAGNMSTTWRLLYQNAGNWSDDSQAGYLLASRQVPYTNASALCATLHEKLAPLNSSLDSGLQKQLAYLVYDGTYKSGQEFWIANGTAIIVPSQAKARLVSRPPHPSENLPVLCTQTAPRNTINETSVDTKWRVTTDIYTGYRDARSFRFNAVPYAAPFKRFEQSSVITSRANVTAILQDQSRRCPQHVSPPDNYSDDCLVMNIYTPAVGKMKTKRPVMMWLHGGGFSSGTGLDMTFDGGEISSRGDVVIVTPNFRLGSIGFLSINDEAPGNYGFNDVLTALAWCKKYIAFFGGDPDNVTLFGQSSGAQMVQRMLGSPKAQGLWSSAIIQSGRPQDQANALQTSAVAQQNASAAVIKELGCDTAADKLACLRALSTDKIINATQFSKMVVDGNYITSPLLDVAGKNGSYVMKLPMMMGFMRDETGSLGYVPPLNASLSEALANATLTPAQQEAVKNNLGSFPQMDVRNITVTAATDATSIKRCGQESTMLAAAQSGQFTSVYGYVQDQRAMQIPDYDPNEVCISDDPNVPYYFCHSGDLIPTFGSARFAFNLPPRDRGDIIWTSLMWDQWSSFARSKKPTPPNEYLEVRGYTSTAEAVNARDGKWEEVRPSASTAKIMSLGPRQRMVTLLQNGAQCEALGLTIDYVSEGR